jgi:hypothetical protein
MPANVIEGAQLAIGSAHNQKRLSCQLGREIVARPRNLIAMSDCLPASPEDSIFLKLKD